MLDPDRDWKTCSQCGEHKLAREFTRSRRERSGRLSYCRACGLKYQQPKSPKYRAAQYRRAKHRKMLSLFSDVPLREIPPHRTKAQIAADAAAARAAKAENAAAYFAAQAAYVPKPTVGSHAWYVSATPAEIAEYRARKRAEYAVRYATQGMAERERSSRYKHAHPAKVARWQGERTRVLAARTDGTLTRQVIGRLFADAEGKRCPYCPTRMAGSVKSLDHLNPRADGGTHSLVNVVVCCRPCNLRKRHMPYAAWLARLSPRDAARALRLYRSRYGCGPTQMALPFSFADHSESAWVPTMGGCQAWVIGTAIHA